jgi:PAS domain S-box-containing protein
MSRPASTTIISVEELWRLFNLSASIFCIAGMDGYFRHINPCFTRILGFSEAELLSRPILEFVHPEDRNMISQKLKALADNCEVSFCGRFQTTGIGYKWLTWSATHPHNDGLIYAAAQDCTDRYDIEKQLIEERISKERKIIEATLYGQEMEKAEIGKELHDNINQMLTTVKLYHEMALSKREMTHSFINKAAEILLATIEEIRGLSKSLVAPGVFEISLTESVNDLIDTIAHGRNIKITFQVDDNKEELPGKVRIMIFRIIQEQLNNILKHAHAKKVRIRLTKDNMHLRLLIQDDGKGFDVKEKKCGIGLKNISSRAKCYDGMMTIDSAPGEGCTMLVFIPLAKIYQSSD